jgi:hypothetical protein
MKIWPTAKHACVSIDHTKVDPIIISKQAFILLNRKHLTLNLSKYRRSTMVGENSLGEKMSLRRKIKPPKPFSGDVMENLSSSIQGDRTIDSSEMKPSSPMSATGLPGDRSLKPETSNEKVPPTKSSRKRAPSTELPKPQKVTRTTREDSEPISRGRALARPGVWRPGAGMTPANNKK